LIKGLDAGGAELLLSMMAKVRDRNAIDYEAAYLLPWKDGLVEELEADGVTVHCLAGGRELDLRWAIRLRQLVRRRGYDIVHIHSPYVAGIARLALRTMAPNSRPRIVYTEHLPWWGYIRPTRWLNRATYRLDDANLAVSRTVRESIPGRLKERVEVVVQGIFVEEVREQLRHRHDVRGELGVRDDEILVGTVAHFRAQKGYPDLLVAARHVIDRGLRVRFIAVGRGPQEPEIRVQQRDLGLGDRFLLAGFRSDATRVLAGCDIFAMASLYEGLPLALMESLALGIPVVATNVGGIAEGVANGVEGVLVPPSRPALLAQAIAALASDSERRRRMSEAAWARAHDFDLNVSVRRMESVYRQAALG
jgi:glycosyltransferase involved in cell wall biosynthesis